MTTMSTTVVDEFGETLAVGDRIACAINEHTDNSDDVHTYRGVVREITDRAIRIEVTDARSLGGPAFEGEDGEFRIGELWYCYARFDGDWSEILGSWHEQFAKWIDDPSTLDDDPDPPVFADPRTWHHYREFGPIIKLG